METITTLTPNEMEAIVGGYHGDPFRVLGPHQAENGRLVIRTFIPFAKVVTVLLADKKKTAVTLDKIHDTGLFEAVLNGQDATTPYQYQIETYGGDTQTIEDPYRFGSTIPEMDRHLLGEGTHQHIYNVLGAQPITIDGVAGTRFAIWAPNALRVSVVGDFNNWDGRLHPMRFHTGIGIWELFIPNLGQSTLYKYEIKTRYHNYTVAKSDPVGFASELRPKTASVVWDINQYEWQDDDWLAERAERNDYEAPISIYEVHLGSWKLKNGWEWLTYRDLADELVGYVKEMGYTHIELLPITEHPFDGSWGYQVTGYFAPTSRFGNPDDFMYFVDKCHQAGIGVILDWVPAHFPMDQHGLGFFDGTHLYEHADPRQGAHPDWGTYIFNYGRNEVRQFLISNALFWIDKYHIDGLRVDAVASMLYLDFSRKQGEWVPNRFGGRENIEALEFIRTFNDKVHENFPGVVTIAEESTSWPGVSHPTAENGLGFDYKWNMGWMHDSLQYFKNDPVYRSYHQGSLTFSMLYAFSEKFVLPFSHDEVVHLKKAMLDKMPGDLWQMFANLRLLYGYMWAHPGKKLLFMGAEFGQWQEWSEARSLDWHLLDQGEGRHKGVQTLVKELNHLYKEEAALHEHDTSWEGFTWLDFRDSARSLLSFIRVSPRTNEKVVVICNFTPVVHMGYRLGVPEEGSYRELLNTDAVHYGGSNVVSTAPIPSEAVPWHDQNHSIQITVPPLAAVFYKKA